MRIADALGIIANPDVGFVVRETFLAMEIAEEALAARGMSMRDGAFLLLKPPPILRGLVPKVYRHHCDELLSRIADGSPGRDELLRPTKAEVLAEFLVWSDLRRTRRVVGA